MELAQQIPEVRLARQFETDDRLGLGEFGIQTRVVHEHEQGYDREEDEREPPRRRSRRRARV